MGYRLEPGHDPRDWAWRLELSSGGSTCLGAAKRFSRTALCSGAGERVLEALAEEKLRAERLEGRLAAAEHELSVLRQAAAHHGLRPSGSLPAPAELLAHEGGNAIASAANGPGDLSGKPPPAFSSVTLESSGTSVVALPFQRSRRPRRRRRRGDPRK